jgi:type IV pilus assembly protein PilC
MAEYLYRARQKTGRFTLGFISANSSVSAAAALKEAGLLAVWVFRCPSPGLPERFNYRGVRKNQLSLFCRQLSAMLEAGVCMEHALVSLSGRAFHKSYKQGVTTVLALLRKGFSLSRALGKYPGLFPELMVNMVQAGEMSGALPEVLKDLAGYYEKENNFTGKVKSILIYPAFLLVATTLLITAMVDFVMPKYMLSYGQMNIAPPFFISLVVKVGACLKICWFLALPVAMALYFLLKKFYNSEVGSRLIMGVPLAGRVLKYSTVSRYCWVAGMLLSRGVPTLEALETAVRTMGNVYAGTAVSRLLKGVMAGQRITHIMSMDSFFPPLLVQMLKIGEEIGALDVSFLRAAHFYSGESEFLLKNILASIEPLIILLMGGVIGLLAAAMLLPMVNLINSL